MGAFVVSVACVSKIDPVPGDHSIYSSFVFALFFRRAAHVATTRALVYTQYKVYCMRNAASPHWKSQRSAVFQHRISILCSMRWLPTMHCTAHQLINDHTMIIRHPPPPEPDAVDRNISDQQDEVNRVYTLPEDSIRRLRVWSDSGS